jgi:hypothetical protein
MAKSSRLIGNHNFWELHLNVRTPRMKLCLLSLQVKNMVATRSKVEGSKAVAAGPLLYTGAAQKSDVEEVMKLARGIKLKSKAGDMDQKHSAIESWVINWVVLRPSHPLCVLAEGLLRKVGEETVERFALKGRAVQVQLTMSEMGGEKVKPGTRRKENLPAHRDGGMGDVILTSVLVWYTYKETGEIFLDGRGSAEFGGA